MADQQAILKTNRGDITSTCSPNHAPKTVANFTGLADGREGLLDAATAAPARYYDGLDLPPGDRDGFMIQGGCPLGTGTGGPGYQFEDEIHPELVFDKPYLLAMANAGPGTNGSQFFITIGATPWLNRKHTIFGEVADQAVARRGRRDRHDRRPAPATARSSRWSSRAVEIVAADADRQPASDVRRRPRRVPTCYRHPGREATSAASAATGRSAPTACAPAAVGFQCPDVRQGGREDDARPAGRRTAGCGRPTRRSPRWC